MSFSSLYIPGEACEIYPNVFIEKGTKLYCPDTIRGRFQQLAFNWGKVYVQSVGNLANSIELLKKISYSDSQLYYPSQFGFVLDQAGIIADLTGFANSAAGGAVWFPANAWVFDKDVKFGVVGSGAKTECYRHFAVEVQFRQTNIVSGVATTFVTNDVWSIYTNEAAKKFFQIKEFLDSNVRRIESQTTVSGGPILVKDVNNISLLPWPPIVSGVTVNSLTLIVNATP